MQGVIMGYLRHKFDQIIAKEQSPDKLAKSFSLGMWIALSPFLGVQTFLVFILGLPLKAHTGIVMILIYLINNPLTMFPIAIFDYLAGIWIFKDLLGINLAQYNPSWMQAFNTFVEKKLGSYLHNYINVADLSIWYYLLGGLIVASIGAIITYPLAHYFFKRLLKKHKQMNAHHENSHHE